MDAVLFGRYFLEFALLYPGAYLCLAPLRDHLKDPKTTYWIAGGASRRYALGVQRYARSLNCPATFSWSPSSSFRSGCCDGGRRE